MALMPLDPTCQDAAIGGGLVEVRNDLSHFIDRGPLLLVEGGTVSDHKLG